MDRRWFLKAVLGSSVLVFIEGCRAPLVSRKVFDQGNGQPWRCGNCGHLTRSDVDLTGTRCPRCFEKRLVRISEEQLQEYLKIAEGSGK
jgi:DNA-directed RNA polymerase subunit RPC12/RpoP